MTHIEVKENREIKFRAWDKENKKMAEVFTLSLGDGYIGCVHYVDGGGVYLREDKFELMQYTGLKDKNGVAEIYEGDIIDDNGEIKGNIYEMDKGETDFVVQGLGTKTWCETYRRAILLGCKDAE